jgi:hypothetical protein
MQGDEPPQNVALDARDLTEYVLGPGAAHAFLQAVAAIALGKIHPGSELLTSYGDEFGDGGGATAVGGAVGAAAEHVTAPETVELLATPTFRSGGVTGLINATAVVEPTVPDDPESSYASTLVAGMDALDGRPPSNPRLLVLMAHNPAERQVVVTDGRGGPLGARTLGHVAQGRADAERLVQLFEELAVACHAIAAADPHTGLTLDEVRDMLASYGSELLLRTCRCPSQRHIIKVMSVTLRFQWDAIVAEAFAPPPDTPAETYTWTLVRRVATMWALERHPPVLLAVCNSLQRMMGEALATTTWWGPLASQRERVDIRRCADPAKGYGLFARVAFTKGNKSGRDKWAAAARARLQAYHRSDAVAEILEIRAQMMLGEVARLASAGVSNQATVTTLGMIGPPAGPAGAAGESTGRPAKRARRVVDYVTLHDAVALEPGDDMARLTKLARDAASVQVTAVGAGIRKSFQVAVCKLAISAMLKYPLPIGYMRGVVCPRGTAVWRDKLVPPDLVAATNDIVYQFPLPLLNRSCEQVGHADHMLVCTFECTTAVPEPVEFEVLDALLWSVDGGSVPRPPGLAGQIIGFLGLDPCPVAQRQQQWQPQPQQPPVPQVQPLSPQPIPPVPQVQPLSPQPIQPVQPVQPVQPPQPQPPQPQPPQPFQWHEHPPPQWQQQQQPQPPQPFQWNKYPQT